MSPGWLLPPFSELVLSSLSQLFKAGGGGTAQEFTHGLPGNVCLSFQPHQCPSAQQHFSIPGCRPGQCCPPPCKLGSRIYLRRGHWSFPPFSPCSLQSTNTKPLCLGEYTWRAPWDGNMQRWLTSRMGRSALQSAASWCEVFPQGWPGAQVFMKIEQGI